MTDLKFLRLVIVVNAALPALLMGLDWQQGRLGANPVEFITRATGVLALLFMVLTLMVTPLRKIFGLNWLLKQRRLLGLVAFFYAAAHLLTYLTFDREWRLATVPADVWQRPFIALGMLSFLLMVPLAATSTNAMIRRLGGRKWNRLHRLTYYIAIGGVAHYWLIVKSDTSWPLLFGFAVAVLLAWRWFAARRQEA